MYGIVKKSSRHVNLPSSYTTRFNSLDVFCKGGLINNVMPDQDWFGIEKDSNKLKEFFGSKTTGHSIPSARHGNKFTY